MFTGGETAIDTRSNRVVLVIEVHELWGMTTCKVIDMTSNNVYSINAENLAASGAASAASESFVRFVAAWCKVKNELANGTVFDTSESVLPLLHISAMRWRGQWRRMMSAICLQTRLDLVKLLRPDLSSKS